MAAETKSSSENPAALYSRCNAAKPRVCSTTGCAHLATKNNRETKPDNWTVKGDAEYGAMTWLKSRGGAISQSKGLKLQAKAKKLLIWFSFQNDRFAIELWVQKVGEANLVVPGGISQAKSVVSVPK